MAVARAAVAGMAAAVARANRCGGARRPGGDPAGVDFPDALRIAGADPDEPDLAPADERALGEWARREHGSDFVFVVGYPMAKRPFYTHPDPERPHLSRGFDLSSAAWS